MRKPPMPAMPGMAMDAAGACWMAMIGRRDARVLVSRRTLWLMPQNCVQTRMRSRIGPADCQNWRRSPGFSIIMPGNPGEKHRRAMP